MHNLKALSATQNALSDKSVYRDALLHAREYQHRGVHGEDEPKPDAAQLPQRLRLAETTLSDGKRRLVDCGVTNNSLLVQTSQTAKKRERQVAKTLKRRLELVERMGDAFKKESCKVKGEAIKGILECKLCNRSFAFEKYEEHVQGRRHTEARDRPVECFTCKDASFHQLS